MGFTDGRLWANKSNGSIKNQIILQAEVMVLVIIMRYHFSKNWHPKAEKQVGKKRPQSYFG